MTKDFEAQLNWFTKKLLQIRLLEVKGLGLPIPFTISEIRRCRAVAFDLREQSPKEHLEDLIEEIKRFYIKNKLGNINDIELKYSGNGNNPTSVTIFGIDSDLLRFFLIKRLKTHTSLLETRAGNALFYVGIDTGVVLSSTGQSILARLRSIKENDEILSYNDIFEICAEHQSSGRAYFQGRNNDQERRNTTARSAVSSLLTKIMSSELFEHMEVEESKKIIKNFPNEGYKLMM